MLQYLAMSHFDASYFIIGLVIAATPGAVLIETIRRTLYNKRTVISFTLGAFAGMTLIILGAFLGMTVIADSLVTQTMLYVLGGMIMVYMGLKAMFGKPKYHTMHRRVLGFKEKYGVFTLGFVLSTTNPLRLLFWGAMVGTFLHESSHFTHVVASILSVYAGMLVFYTIIISLLGSADSYFKQRHILALSRLMGVVVAGFGLSALLKTIG